MATKESGNFETSIDELDAIVKRLESEDVGLDESVALFKRAKDLATHCERLLKEAQAAIDAASTPQLTAVESKPTAPAAPSSLFDERVEDDEIPF